MFKQHSLRFVLVALLLMFSAFTVIGQVQYTESPMLAERVASDALPPVAERLPAQPMVIDGSEGVGTYGGDIRLSMQSSSYERGDLLRTVGYDGLVRWNADWTAVIPNLAERFEVNTEGNEFTFYLRPGTKWSDGVPFTTEDVRFWYEDVSMNTDIFPNGPRGFMINKGVAGRLEVIDEYTFKIVFDDPNGLFLQLLATADGAGVTAFPRHYVEQYHINYNPENVEKLRVELGLETWVDVFNRFAGDEWTDGIWTNPERPTLHGWVTKTPFDPAMTQMVFERNPYYWKVDSAGNQLPYLDTLTFAIFQDAELLKLQTINGDLDFVRAGLQISDKPVIFENQEKGGYRIVEQSSDLSNTCVFYPNLTSADPVKAPLLANREFRVALSHAIDRGAMIDTLYVSQGEPSQVAPRPESKYYNETLAKQYTEYNPDEANTMLDALGYTERDSDGYRLNTDGSRITFFADVQTGAQPHIDCIDLVAGYWKAVGVELLPNVVDRTLFLERQRGNQHEFSVNWGASGLGEVLNAKMYVPIAVDAEYAIPWYYWWNDKTDARGVEPPAEVQAALNAYDEMVTTSDPAAQDALMQSILENATAQFYAIGISTQVGSYGIASNTIGNLPPMMINSWRFQTPGPYVMETWYLK